MNKRLGAVALLAMSMSLPSMVVAAPDTFPAKPMFKAGPSHNDLIPPQPASTLPHWQGSYTDLTGQTVTFWQIGGNPATTNTTSTISVLIIPVKFVLTQNGTKYVFDPKRVRMADNHNRNVIQALLKSPLFTSDVDFHPKDSSCGKNCVDLGRTQYIDAFQRGTWWGNDVGSNTDYHVLLSPTVEKEQTITADCKSGCVVTEFGVQVGLYGYYTLASNLKSLMKNIADVNPGVLALFVSYDVYLQDGNGCCIGGFHDRVSDAWGGPDQTYAWATYVDQAGAFSQDVSALSHEIGEWMDDPYVFNIVHCKDNSLMEVGDPLVNAPNYGAYQYKDNGFTWNLQSLVYMSYFGAPLTDSANQWYALQDDMSQVCPGQ